MCVGQYLISQQINKEVAMATLATGAIAAVYGNDAQQNAELGHWSTVVSRLSEQEVSLPEDLVAPLSRYHCHLSLNIVRLGL